MKFVKYVQDTKGGLNIPAIPAPKANFATAEEAVTAALNWEKEVTRQITALMTQANKENDYLAQSFLQWFIDEQLEEVVKMERMLGRRQAVRREEPADGRGLPRPHRESALIEQHFLDDCLFQLRKLKAQADKAMAQVDDAQFFALLDPDANSIALIVKHVAGNMRSRWTDFLTTDGEKPDRNRDSEFEREAARHARGDHGALGCGMGAAVHDHRLARGQAISARPSPFAASRIRSCRRSTARCHITPRTSARLCCSRNTMRARGGRR